MKFFVFFFLFLISILKLNSAYAFDIDAIVVKCKSSSNCNEIRKVFSSVRGNYKDVEHFETILKLYVANEGIKRFYYKVEGEGTKNTLYITLQTKPIIKSIVGPKVIGPFEIEFPSILPLREDEYLDTKKVDNTLRLLTDIARDKGFPRVKARAEVQAVGSGSEVTIHVDLGKPIVVQEVIVNSKSERIKRMIEEKIGYHEGEPFDPQKMRNELEDLRKIFLQYGYYLIDFDFKNRISDAGGSLVYVDVVGASTHSFHINNSKFFTEAELKEYLSGQLISLKRKISNETIAQLMKEYYLKKGFRTSTFEVKNEKSVNEFGDPNNHYLIACTEGKRSYFQKLRFKGNSYFEDKVLRNHFYENAPETISVQALDKEYLDQFKDKLRELYITEGYVSVFVGNPEIQELAEDERVQLSYRIREGIQTKIDKFKLDGLPDKLLNKVNLELVNKSGTHFNPIAFKEDLKFIETYLRNEGYYFAKIENLNSPNLVEYKQDNARVDILIKVNLGRKLFVDEILVIGNKKTRKRLIEREIFLKKGDLLTRNAIESSQTNLLSLGLFSSVQIKPVDGNQKNTDVIIFVREKDFGTFELAPGIRTDIGLKLSTTINYNNIDGLNKRISFKGTVNRRFDLTTLDKERRKSSSSLVEYDGTLNYSENNIFRSEYNFGLLLNKSRRRFYSFDADIQRISYSVTRVFTNWFSARISQQLETISQFDATQDRDHGFFQIGSFTPSVIFDFRNRPVNPTKGAIFDLAVEFANPFFLSQQDDDLTIDYYKLTSRNRFYLPISNSMVFAMSTTFGVQENLATDLNSNGEKEGYIPGIKVFRLVGADIIRGFQDDEMNRLDNGEDISAVAIDSRAYLFNFKFEPRYYINDSMIFGVFYDAGRVFVDEFDFNDLRSSAGLTFKLLLPFGTVDFDYGIKLLRKRDTDGNLESPGRLHVSIGFF